MLNLYTATEQEVFDYVYVALVRQGGPSHRLDGSPGCAYRGRGGRRCAAGWLIPDEEYSKAMEGATAASLSCFRARPHSELIFDLQQAHDLTSPDRGAEASDMPDEEWRKPWLQYMQSVAQKRKLTMPVGEPAWGGE